MGKVFVFSQPELTYLKDVWCPQLKLVERQTGEAADYHDNHTRNLLNQ